MRTRGTIITVVAAALALSAPVAARGEALPFAHPPTAVKPKFRWWWGDLPFAPPEFVSEVDGFASAGFGGAEAAFGAALGGGTGWANPDQRTALTAALQAAQRDGIRLD